MQYAIRRSVLATSAAAGAFGLVLLAAPCYAQTAPAVEPTSSFKAPTITLETVQHTRLSAAIRDATADATAIRPFHVNVSDAALVDLRRRIAATRGPDRETVHDQSQNVPLAKIQALVRYWGTDYDWRKAEATLNALPQFVTTIDGLDIQFVHVRSRHPNAIPLIMTHAWPGSPFELLQVIGPLTDPTAHSGRADDAFDLVLPTYPGYGFSGKPQGGGWGPDHVARAWDELMRRLGYTRYVAQGGDWGAIIAAWEEPELFATEIRAAFRSLR